MELSEPLLIEDYNYPLADERIAKYPLQERDHSKLLLYRDGSVSEDRFYNIGNYLPSGSLLVYNNTRVIQARLVFHKSTGARIEVFCLEPLSPRDYALSLGSTDGCTWKCMIGNLKKWKDGMLQLTIASGRLQGLTLFAERISTTGNTSEIRFSWSFEASKLRDIEMSEYRNVVQSDNAADNISFAEILDALGELPIPPYLHRPTEESDKTTYQTVYSRIKGSVAAPTAGLHFTGSVLDDLRKRGVLTCEITLHVGAGTFQPVKTADANQHTMHTEIIAVPRVAIKQLVTNLGHIVAVGTTTVRTLESLYYLGVRACKSKESNYADMDFHVNQFEPYENGNNDIEVGAALKALLEYLDFTAQDTLHAETQIMIKPGYRFHIIDYMITNFHQPKSTLLLLVSAFVGGDWHTIYDYALSHDFRFLSYGDSSLLKGVK